MSAASSPARLRYRAERAARRHPAVTAMRAVHDASRPKVTGDSVLADAMREAANAVQSDFVLSRGAA